MPTRRALLGAVAGGWTALAGCTGTTGDRPGATGDRQPGEHTTSGRLERTTTGDTTPGTTRVTTEATRTTTGTDPRPSAQRPIDLGLSLRYATTTPTADSRVPAHRTRADCFDAVRIDGEFYRPRRHLDLPGGAICHVIPTHRHVVSGRPIPLRPADFPREAAPADAGALPSGARSLFAEALASEDGRVVVATRTTADVAAAIVEPGETTTTTERSPDRVEQLFGGRRARYLRRDGQCYLLRRRWETDPECAQSDVDRTVSFEPLDGKPGADASVLRTVGLTASEADTLDAALSSWVARREGTPSETVRRLAAAGPLPAGERVVSLSLTRTESGYRLAAVRLFGQSRPCPALAGPPGATPTSISD